MVRAMVGRSAQGGEPINPVSMKKYLKPFRIQSRWTTFNGAFQLALAVHEEYDAIKVDRLINELGQRHDDLRCVYCREPAMTWDHLFNNVKDTRFSGYGNRIFNLVPACRSCNERKGGKHWRLYLTQASKSRSEAETKTAEARLAAVEALDDGERYPWSRIEQQHPELAARYGNLITDMRAKLHEMDELATLIRDKVRAELRQSPD